MKTRGFNLLSWAALSLALVLFDQYTKLLAVAHLKGKTPFVILEGVFELLYSENRGAAFGMLQETGLFLCNRNGGGSCSHLCDVAHAWLEQSALSGPAHVHHSDYRRCAGQYGGPYHSGLCGGFPLL